MICPLMRKQVSILFLDCLEHYMEWVLISQSNHKAVKLAIMVEAGTNVREMDPMKKDLKEKAFLNSYMSIIWESPVSILKMKLFA
jgi:hypothetical protein